jgi:hypothetical protein
MRSYVVPATAEGHIDQTPRLRSPSTPVELVLTLRLLYGTILWKVTGAYLSQLAPIILQCFPIHWPDPDRLKLDVVDEHLIPEFSVWPPHPVA